MQIKVLFNSSVLLQVKKVTITFTKLFACKNNKKEYLGTGGGVSCKNTIHSFKILKNFLTKLSKTVSIQIVIFFGYFDLELLWLIVFNVKSNDTYENLQYTQRVLGLFLSNHYKIHFYCAQISKKTDEPRSKIAYGKNSVNSQ